MLVEDIKSKSRRKLKIFFFKLANVTYLKQFPYKVYQWDEMLPFQENKTMVVIVVC